MKITKRPKGETTGTIVQRMKAALAGTIAVRTWWGCDGLTGSAFRRWFRGRLADKINRNDKRNWRRLDQDYQTRLYRDAQRVRDIGRRVIVRQFETDLFNRRLGHLLWKGE